MIDTERLGESPHCYYSTTEGFFQFLCDEENTPMAFNGEWEFCPLCGEELTGPSELERA